MQNGEESLPTPGPRFAGLPPPALRPNESPASDDRRPWPEGKARPSLGPDAMDPRYLVVFGACVTQFTIVGLLFSVGLFFNVLEEELGWSRTLLSGSTSLAFLVMGVLAFFVGRLSDRYGPSVVLGTAGLLYGIGYGLISVVGEPWQLIALFGIFIGLGLSAHDVVTLSTIARWFEHRRGMMTGGGEGRHRGGSDGAAAADRASDGRPGMAQRGAGAGRRGGRAAAGRRPVDEAPAREPFVRQPPTRQPLVRQPPARPAHRRGRRSGVCRGPPQPRILDPVRHPVPVLPVPW